MLAIVILLGAITLLIIGRWGILSIEFIALAALSKLFPVFLLPAFLKRSRRSFTGIFASMMLLGYLPFAGAGRHLFVALSDFAAQWEGNDSLYRRFLTAGNSSRQARLVSGIFLLLLTTYVLKTRMDIFQSALVALGGLLFLSSNAFP